MGNINDHLRGRTVTTNTGVRTRCFGTDFPGWGAPDAAAHLVLGADITLAERS